MSAAVAVTLAAVAGLAGAVQIAVNGKLGERIGVLPAFTFSVLVSAVLATAVLLAVRQSLGGLAAAVREPAWLWLGGVMGAIIVFAITVVTPRIGATATIALVIAGNLAMGAVIDRFGLFGLDRITLSWPRIVGIVLLAVGAALSLKR